MIKTILAFIGGFVVLLGLLGTLGAGNFVLMYDYRPITCIKGSL